MGGQEIYEPNPPPDQSQLPDEILAFRTQLNTRDVLSPDELRAVRQFRKAADYIAGGAPSRFASCGTPRL